MRSFGWRLGSLGLVVVGIVVLGSEAQAAGVTKVCVDVEVRNWSDASKQDEKAPSDVSKDEASSERSTWFRGRAARLAKDEEPTAEGWTNGETTETGESLPGSGEVTAGESDTPGASASDVVTNGEAPIPSLVRLPTENQPSPMPEPRVLEKPNFEIQPDVYLTRLIEHYVTHRDGFEAVGEGCAEQLTVELYELAEGWTVFARYSGHAREEKVDEVRLDEFDSLANRLAAALLGDVALTETLSRTTVLRADSQERLRTIKGTSHFLLGVGSAARFGLLPTAPNDTDPAVADWRFQAPLAFSMGARNKFRAWGLDAYGRLFVGTSELATRHNRGGGHSDYDWGFAAGLHFLRYADAEGINTLYYGGGAGFELSSYTILGGTTVDGFNRESSNLWSGGLNVDLLIGYEFMRASSMHFFVEADVNLPTYLFDSENHLGSIRAWLPSAVVQAGILY